MPTQAEPKAPPSAQALTHEALRVLASDGDALAKPLLTEALSAWEKETGQPVQWFDARREALPAVVIEHAVTVLDPTSRRLAQSRGATITLFDTAGWKRALLFTAHEGLVRDIVFGPRGDRLWSAGTDGKVKLWDIGTGKLVHASSGNDQVDRLLVSPGGERLVYRCGGHLCSWKTSDDEPEQRQLRAPEGCLAVRHWLEGTLAIAGNDGDEPCFIDVQSGAVRKTLPFITGLLRFPRAGDTFLTAVPTARTVRVEVWSASKGQRLRSLSTTADDGTSAVALAMPSLSPDGTKAIALTGPRELTRWDTSTGHVQGRMPTDFDVARADYLRDGRVLLWHAEGASFDLVDGAFSRIEAGLRAPASVYHTLELTPDGKGFAAGVQDYIQVWDLEAGSLSYSLHDPEPLGRSWLLRFSPDGKRLAALHPRGVRVWDVASKAVVHRISPRPGERITAIAFDAEGRLVVIRSKHPPTGGLKDGEATVVDLSGQPPSSFFVGAHAAVQVSAHGKRIAIAPPGKGIRVFDTERRALIREISVAGTWSLSPDGAWIAYVGKPAKAKSDEASLQVVRVSDGKEWVLEQAPTPAGPLAWRSDNALFAASLVGADGAHDVVLIDPASRSIAVRTPMGRPPDSYYLTLLPDGGRLIARYRSGGMSFHRLRDGVSEASLAFMDDGQTWLAWTEPGTFDMGGPEADGVVGCRAGARVLPFPLCEVRFRKPGLLRDALR